MRQGTPNLYSKIPGEFRATDGVYLGHSRKLYSWPGLVWSLTSVPQPGTTRSVLYQCRERQHQPGWQQEKGRSNSLDACESRDANNSRDAKPQGHQLKPDANNSRDAHNRGSPAAARMSSNNKEAGFKCGGGGELRVLSQWVPYSCAQGAQINFGDITPYLTYGKECPSSVRTAL